MPDLLCLDLDGTLLDARPRQAEVAHAAAMTCGVELDGDAFWNLKREGATTRDAFVELGHDAEAERMHAWWVAHIEEPNWLELDVALPGALATVRTLAESGLRLKIVTARRNAAGAQDVIQRAGFAELCSTVVVDPDVAVEAKADVLRNEDAIGYIGDSEADVQAASTARVPFVAVATGQRSRTFLTNLWPAVADDLAEACRLLELIPSSAMSRTS